MVVEFNPENKAALDNLLLGNPFIRPGKMFGFPAYYAGKKVCITLYEQGVAVKLPEQRVTGLIETDPNAVPFQPMGKAKMREWVQINLGRPEDIRQYEAVFDESIRFVVDTQSGSLPE